MIFGEIILDLQYIDVYTIWLFNSLPWLKSLFFVGKPSINDYKWPDGDGYWCMLFLFLGDVLGDFWGNLEIILDLIYDLRWFGISLARLKRLTGRQIAGVFSFLSKLPNTVTKVTMKLQHTKVTPGGSGAIPSVAWDG